MSVKNLIDTAVYSRLTGGTALIAVLGGTAIYNTHAPDGASLPYVVYSQQTGSPDNLTPSDSRTLLYWVRVYSSSGAQAGTIDALVSGLLHKQTLTVTGYTNYGTRRETEISTIEIDDAGRRIYQSGAFYRIQIDQ